VSATNQLDYDSSQNAPVGKLRWLICGLLCLAIILIYIHRNVVSVLQADTLAKIYHWGALDFSHLGMAFTGGYAIGLVGAGRFLDRVGVRVGFLIAVIIWTVLAMAHGFIQYLPAASAINGLISARFLLGIVEGAFFPAAIRATAEWFPKKERAFSTGVFNAGSAFGALLSPLLVPLVVAQWSWPMAFYLSGGLGIVWIVCWLAYYREPENDLRLSPAELQYIRSDWEPPVKSMPWLKIIGYKQTWAFFIGKFMTDPIWWFYIFWLPSFLHTKFNVDLKHFGPPLVVVYLMADGGSILGGWVSSRLIRAGWTINHARKGTMLLCALCVLPILSVTFLSNMWAAIILIGLAAGAHQGWSANIFTLASDVTPKPAISSVVGFGGMGGAVGGFLFQKFVGNVVDKTGAYFIPFAVAGVAYISVLVVIQVMLPKLEMMKLEESDLSPASAS
jgi:ACS family hexuronate transporter-like MFS transporter